MTTKVLFPLVLAAVQNGDKATTWDIGRALLKEIPSHAPAAHVTKDRDGSLAEIDKCYKMLVQLGCKDYTIRRLAELRNLAIAFKPKDVVPDVSAAAHLRAGSPEVLDAVLKGLKKAGKSHTRDNVVTYLRIWRQEEKAAKAAAAEAARKDREDADQRAKEAGERQIAANSDDARDKAKEERRKAKEDAAAAKEREREAKAHPVGVPNAPEPTKSELEVRAVIFKIEADAQLLVKGLKKTLDALAEVQEFVQDNEARLIERSYNQVINIATDIVKIVGKLEKPRLTVVGGKA